MSTRLEVYYLTPEGSKSQVINTDEAPEKMIKQFMLSGLTIERQTDSLYIPPHAIQAITFFKQNK